MDDKQKHITYGQAANLATDFHLGLMRNIGETDITDELFIEMVIATADKFYTALLGRQTALAPLPEVVPAQTFAAETQTSQYDEPPMEAYVEEALAAVPVSDEPMESTGLGMHRDDQWEETTIRCQGCGLYSLVKNKRMTGPRFECGSRQRKVTCGQKGTPKGQPGHDHVNECYETVSKCNYTVWAD